MCESESSLCEQEEETREGDGWMDDAEMRGRRVGSSGGGFMQAWIESARVILISLELNRLRLTLGTGRARQIGNPDQGRTRVKK